MPSSDSEYNPHPHLRPGGRRSYPIILFSAAVGAYIFLQFVYDWDTGIDGLIALIGLLVVLFAPMVMGYTDHGLAESVATGLLPVLGHGAGNWVFLPLTAEDYHNIFWVTIHSVLIGLPVVTLSFIIGTGLRSRADLREHAVRFGVAFVVSIALGALGLYLRSVISVGVAQ